MLESEAVLEGVARISSRALDQSQLKKYDKNEKQLVTSLAQTQKGKTQMAERYLLSNIYCVRVSGW